MKAVAHLLSVIGLAASLGACATVTRGTTEKFTVNSTPPGAAVKTSTGFSCASTPCSMKVPRKTAFDVTLTKAGYVTRTEHVRSGVAGGGAAGLAGNIVAGGVIGMVVDGTSGAMNDLTPNPVNATLEPEAPTPAVASADQTTPAKP
jgi:hypothetical protein